MALFYIKCLLIMFIFGVLWIVVNTLCAVRCTSQWEVKEVVDSFVVDTKMVLFSFCLAVMGMKT